MIPGKAELAKIVGEEHVGSLAESARDNSPPLLVRPGSVEEISQVVALAHRQGWKVQPRGAGTRPLPVQPEEPIDLVLEVTRLNRVVEHCPDDLVASVQCGLGITECQRILGRKGQRIPLDPPNAGGATIGGALATNSFGPRRLKYGTARDWVIGTTLVRFDGKLVRSGGMVVKNVSGYDLSKLYIGSWGTLGILVRANFKLDPLPAAEGTLVLEVPERPTACRIVAGARQRPLTLNSAVLVRGGRSMFPPQHPTSGSVETGHLLLGLEGIPGVLERQAESLAELAEREGSSSCRWLTDEAAAQVRERLAAAQTEPEAVLHLRVNYPPASHDSLMAEFDTIDRPERFSEFSMLGSGVSWLGWEDAGLPERWAERVRQLRAICGKHGGWLVVERQPADRRGVVPPWQIPQPQLRLMSRLKAALDPSGTFPTGPLLERAQADG